MRSALPNFALVAVVVIACGLSTHVKAEGTSYKDGVWGVVPQNGGKLCMIVLNSDDQKRAFHFLISGSLNVARIEILEKFLPERRYLTTSNTSVTVDLGPQFARRLDFAPKSGGTLRYITATLEPDNLSNVLAALQQTRGVSLAFENGVKWQFRAPRNLAAASPAITQCWEEASRGMRGAAAPGLFLDEAREQCMSANPDIAIAGCSAVIASIALTPKSREGLAIVHNNRGLAYNRSRQYERAIQDLNEAIRLDPNYAPAFHNRGLAFQQNGEYNDALADYDRAIQLGLKNAETFNNRGTIYASRGEYERAIADYDQAIRLDPKDAKNVYNRGFTYRVKGQYDRAIQDYDQAIRLNPNLAVAWLERGTVYLEKGEYDRAIQDFNEAIRLDPIYASAINNRGNAYLAKGEYDRAIQDYDQVIQLRPDDALAFCNRSLAKSKKGDIVGSTVDIVAAKRLNPNFRRCTDLTAASRFQIVAPETGIGAR
jgi:tetratricopeptide (TPR) repeat protein